MVNAPVVERIAIGKRPSIIAASKFSETICLYVGAFQKLVNVIALMGCVRDWIAAQRQL